ncbi:MAG: ParA family protein [Pseudodesulfovibrio sp.]|uniref:ParA family protein n=1 Tax=Pseudodesulfovibrio sp. TaxID=2035812 RepID=UPI003D0AA5A3
MSAIISIVNNKGGVGKTTLACNLGHCLAQAGKRTLVVDMDSQCNASGTLLGEEPEMTIYELYTSDDVKTPDCIHPSKYENLDVLPSAPEAFVLESEFAKTPGKGFHLLHDKLAPYAREHYDVTILDSPPNLGMYAVQGLVCSDYVIVPIECGSRYAIDGLKRIIDTILEIKDKTNPGLKDVRILVNRLDRRTTVGKLSNLRLRKTFGDRVFNAIIPINSSIQQAEMAGCSVVDFAPSSTGAFNYRLLTKELLAVI